MVRKAVIPAAGLGTRLLPATKEMPKEMLPLFSKSRNRVVLKPLLQIIYEQLYAAGIREFCIITGRTKRAIEDHFTPDENYLNYLLTKNKSEQAEELEKFYQKLKDSTAMWVNQPKPKGLGDAVNQARSFIGSEAFIVHAGDTYIHSNKDESEIIKRLIEVSERLQPDAVFLTKEVEDPRHYGVAETLPLQENGVYMVRRVEEKPERPRSNLAIVPIYLFKPTIYRALEDMYTGKGGETQLTDAIQKLIEWEKNVYTIKLDKERYLDIGRAENYLEAITLSYMTSTTKRSRILQRILPKLH